jgi:hypothetical protein
VTALRAVLLLTGTATALVAALLPQLFPVWMARGRDSIRTIHDHLRVWKLDSLLFLASAGTTLAGTVLLFEGRDARHDPLIQSCLTLLVVGTALWSANLAFRLTVTVTVAQALEDGPPAWYGPMGQWAAGLWLVGAGFLGVAFSGLGLAIVLGAVLPAWSGWIAIAFGLISLGLAAFTRDTPPVILYLIPLPWGIAALIGT